MHSRNIFTAANSFLNATNLRFGSLLATSVVIYAADESCVSEERIFRKAEVESHSSKQAGVWVTHKGGVYDVTKFVPNHPGGQDKILLAAGKDIGPYWKVYQQHYNSKLPQELLESMRIGSLHPDDIEHDEALDESDPYSKDPEISPILHTFSKKPINASPPDFILTDSWTTPNALWFVRNHHPVSQIDPNKFTLNIGFDTGDGSQLSFSLEDIKSKFPQATIVATVQCGGNRRSELNSVNKTNGLDWASGAISNAKWKGVRLRDVIAHLLQEKASQEGASKTVAELLEELEESDIKHVQFHSADGLEASIPLRKALCKYGDVLLAYEMNDEALPAAHGFPLRVIVPGHVGVRNVKWVTDIKLSKEEAKGAWQSGMAYKGFGPSVKSLEGIDVEAIPSLQEQPVQSAITSPIPHSTVPSDEPLTVKGYAYSGGGRGIVRVDVSIDGGATWKTATLTEGADQPLDRAWAWTFWECDFDLEPVEYDCELGNNTCPAPRKPMQVICKATDASYNVQPDSLSGIWNLRGINNNAWHRVNVDVIPTAETDEDDE